MREFQHKTRAALVEHGGTSSFPADADLESRLMVLFLEGRGVPFTMEYHPRSGWKFTVLEKEKRT